MAIGMVKKAKKVKSLKTGLCKNVRQVALQFRGKG